MKKILLIFVICAFIFNTASNNSMATENSSINSTSLISKIHVLCKYTYLRVSEEGKAGEDKNLNNEKIAAENLSFFFWGLEALTAVSLGIKMGDLGEPIYQQYILSKGISYITTMRALQVVLMADVVRQLACSGSNPKEGAMIALNNLMTTESLAYASTMSDYYKTKKGLQEFLKLPLETQKFYASEDESLKVLAELSSLYKDLLN